MMTQLTAVVAQEPALEAILAEAELAQYLEQQSSAIASAKDNIASSAEALLPVQEVAIASIPSERSKADIAAMPDRSFPETMPAGDSAGGIPPQMPSPTQDLLQSIRIGWRDLAAETARNIQRLSQATVEQALEMGQQLLRMQRDLKRKEYSTFLSILGWASVKARKFINLVKVFDGFELSQLVGIELTTLLSLCSKRYSAVVDQLREVQDITQQLVEQLIKDTKKPRIPKQDPISGWKANRAGGGRRYEVILHSEEVGLSIERQAESEAILPHRVIEEAVALREQHKEGLPQPNEYYRTQLEELKDVVDNARELEQENRHLELELSKRSSRIVELEAKLASGVVPLVVEADAQATQSATVASNEPNQSQQLTIATANATVTPAIALDKITEPYPESRCTNNDSKEPEQPADDPEPEPTSENLEPELPPRSQVEQPESPKVLELGDLVQINATSDRTWNGLSGYIQNLFPATGKAAVLLQGDYCSKHFFLDSLKLVHSVEENLSGATPARAQQLELVEEAATTTVPNAVAPEAIEDSNSTSIHQDVVAPEQVQSASTTTIPQDVVAPEQVQSASLPQLSDDSATSKQILAADWDMLQELRSAENELRKIEAKIQGLNSQITKSGSNPVVEREVLPVLKKQQDLRKGKVSQLVELINSSVIPAYYEEQQDAGRVVLDPKYASAFLMQSKSWSDVVLVVEIDGKQLLSALKDWTKESRQLLVRLLSEYLETDPDAFNQIDWIPEKLLSRALSTQTFTVQRIKKSDNLVDEPEMEYLIGCQFSSFSNLGTRHERWVFNFEGNFIPAFGRSEFSVEKF